jgi:hypothetical protein
MAGLTKEQRAQRAAEKAEAERRQAEEAAREAGAVDVENTTESAVDKDGDALNVTRIEDSEPRYVMPLHRRESGRMSVGDPETDVETIRMVRDEPMHVGGPTGADVHPGEVENWSAAGWRVE